MQERGKQVSSTDGTGFYLFIYFLQGHWQTSLPNTSTVSFDKNVIRGLQELNPVFPHRSKVRYLQIRHAWQLYVTAVSNESWQYVQHLD